MLAISPESVIQRCVRERRESVERHQPLRQSPEVALREEARKNSVFGRIAEADRLREERATPIYLRPRKP